MMDDVLLTVADVMTPTPLSVTTRDTVTAAAEIIRRQALAGLPVVEEGRVLGLVTPLHLLLEPPYRPVGDVMMRGLTPASPEFSLLQAYSLMTRQSVDVLPVVDAAGAVIGQISVPAVLRAQGQQTDPLTGLPWATALRSWALEALSRGHEITILFIDLDNFGEVNKALGHVVGDDILRSIAHLLASLTDPARDLLCRYGGDEFAIATMRQEDETLQLVERVQDTVVLPVEIGGRSHQVTVSVGVAGGRRGEGRRETHAPATVEDLLMMASRASTAIKEAKRLTASSGPLAASVLRSIESAAEAGARRSPDGGAREGRAGEARMQLIDVVVHAGEAGCDATVTLRLGSREGVGRASGAVHGRGIPFVVAEATLAAIRRTIGDQHAFILEELTEVPSAYDNLVVTVLANPAEGTRGFVGGARSEDPHQAVTKAILDALNRPLARALAACLREETAP